MPAKSEKQRKLFGAALGYKRGTTKGVSKQIRKLAELPTKTLEDFAKKPKGRKKAMKGR